jgi:hypothetical protein
MPTTPPFPILGYRHSFCPGLLRAGQVGRTHISRRISTVRDLASALESCLVFSVVGTLLNPLIGLNGWLVTLAEAESVVS